MIGVRRMGDLTEQERAIIELEENLHRKNLTPIERSQTTVRLVEAVGAHLRGQEITQEGQGTSPDSLAVMDTQTRTSPEPDAKQSNFDRQAVKRRPYQEKPDSQKKVAAEIGMTQSQVSDAQRHVAAIARYPELGAPDLSLKTALRLCRAWDAMSSSKRARARKTWNAKRQAKQDQAEDATGTPKAPKPKAKTPRTKGTPLSTLSAQARLTRTWDVFSAGLMQVINDFEGSGGTAPLLACWTKEEWARAQTQLQERLTQLERISRELEVGAPKGTQMGSLRVIQGQEG
jgi:hypothetical protein